MAIHINHDDYYPSQNKVYSVDFTTLSGGLNIRELDYRLEVDESPNMKNLWWKDGILQSRDGQRYVTTNTGLGTGYTCYDSLFYDYAFIHIGTSIYYFNPSTQTTLTLLGTGIPANRGTFFRYSDWLFYKNNGGFFKISYSATENVSFSMSSVTTDAYTPTTIINGNPATGSGDMYQPENRLQAKKTIKYNASQTDATYEELIGNREYETTITTAGSTITIPHKTVTGFSAIEHISLNDEIVNSTYYSIAPATGVITFTKRDMVFEQTMTASGTTVTLPYTSSTGLSVVSNVYVNDIELESSTDFTVTLSTGVITFTDTLEEDDAVKVIYVITSNLLVVDDEVVVDYFVNTDRVFQLGYDSSTFLASVPTVYVNNSLQSDTLYTVDLDAGTITFDTAPTSGVYLEVNMKIGVNVYYLPVKPVDSVVSVVVDDETKTETTDYTVDLTNGKITFVTPPAVTDPATNNTVVITYSLANADAYNAIMENKYVLVGGGNDNLCIIMAGCSAQPNAVYWNGNTNVAMDASYWPMEFYNLVGATEDPVTGFGKQYDDLILFKEHAVGKLTYGVETVDDRDDISFTYETVNSRIGCDLPWTIQLIENNLVFCNTYYGIHILLSSSAAYENNIQTMSLKINESYHSGGLLETIRDASVVTSFDDDRRYWLCADGECYLWDYSVSEYKDPSYFYFTNVNAIAFFRDDSHETYHLNSAGRITIMDTIYNDYNDAIDKLYVFPTQYMGGYYRLKDVTDMLIAVRSDTDTTVKIQYMTDYEERYDLTDIKSRSWRLSPRNLAYRYLGVSRYACVAKRRPNCRHIKHFAFSLQNNIAGEDLAIVSAQVYYNFQGRER